MVQVVFSPVMKTLSFYKQNALTVLAPIYGPRESANIVEYWLEQQLGLTRVDQVLRAKEIFPFEGYDYELAELIARKPVQYIVGHTFFYGLKIGLNSATLIPRPETEELVREVIQLIDNSAATSIIDIGTGSGCIALAIKSKRPDINVIGIDINPKAIAQAINNAKYLDLAVDFRVGDVFNYVMDSVDIIVSNPPYIPNNERYEMETHVVAHEPERALFVPDERPLLFYDALFALSAKSFAYRGGWAAFEIHHLFGEEMKALSVKHNAKEVKLIQDLQGKDRMLLAKYGRTD